MSSNRPSEIVVGYPNSTSISPSTATSNSTIQQVEQLNSDDLMSMLLQEGFDPSTPAFQNQVSARMTQLETRQRASNENARQRPEGYIKTRNVFLSMRDISALIFNFMFIVLGIPIATLGLFFSEFIAVNLGISTFFRQDPLIVGILSFALIALLFAVEWQHAALIKRHGKPNRFKWTIARLTNWWNYAFNSQAMPQLIEETHTDIVRVNQARNVLIVLIVLVGVLGRLDTQIAAMQGVWYTSIVSIFTESTLEDFLGYIGGATLALAMLSATHYIIGYVYDVYLKAVGNDEQDFFVAFDVQAERENLLRMLYAHKLKQVRDAKEAKRANVTVQQDNRNFLPPVAG